MKKSEPLTCALEGGEPRPIKTPLLLAISPEAVWKILLAAGCVPVLWFLVRYHAFVPMWIEGIGEYENVLRIMLGYSTYTPGCWINYGSLHLPLALNAYIGPAFFYFHLPAAYLWFHGLTTDPYVYRYLGILFFFGDVWLLYYLLRKYYQAAVCFYAAAAFLTAPTLFLCLTEGGAYFFMLFFLFTLALLFTQYLNSGRVIFLYASALVLGMTILTRVEMFVWLIVPFTIYLVLARPPLVVQRWREMNHKVKQALATLGCFCLGASPMIVYNSFCPTTNIFSFFRTQLIPHTLTTPYLPLYNRCMLRLAQFWATVLLNTGPVWELKAKNYIFAGLGLVCIGALIWQSVARRRPNFLVLAVLTTLPLSLLASGMLRYEHLTILHPVVLLIIVAGLAYLERLPRLRGLMHAAFVLLILGNIATSAADWRIWAQQPDTAQTMLNQSDPALLTNYLVQHHANDRIFYTNVGMSNYVRYMTAGRLQGEDIMDWSGVDGFVQAVNATLTNKTQRRVFVAVAKEHDGQSGSVRRTELLHRLLDQYDVPYTVTPLSNERNRFLYELVVLEPGAAVRAQPDQDEKLVVSDVTDVRATARQPGGQVVGSIGGLGLKPGDLIVINQDHTFPTTFGNERWVTFSIPWEELKGQDSFTLEVLRSSSLERSQPFTVNLKR